MALHRTLQQFTGDCFLTESSQLKCKTDVGPSRRFRLTPNNYAWWRTQTWRGSSIRGTMLYTDARPDGICPLPQNNPVNDALIRSFRQQTEQPRPKIISNFSNNQNSCTQATHEENHAAINDRWTSGARWGGRLATSMVSRNLFWSGGHLWHVSIWLAFFNSRICQQPTDTADQQGSGTGLHSIAVLKVWCWVHCWIFGSNVTWMQSSSFLSWCLGHGIIGIISETGQDRKTSLWTSTNCSAGAYWKGGYGTTQHGHSATNWAYSKSFTTICLCKRPWHRRRNPSSGPSLPTGTGSFGTIQSSSSQHEKWHCFATFARWDILCLDLTRAFDTVRRSHLIRGWNDLEWRQIWSAFYKAFTTRQHMSSNIVAPPVLSKHPEAYDKAVGPLHVYGQFSSQRWWWSLPTRQACHSSFCASPFLQMIFALIRCFILRNPSSTCSMHLERFWIWLRLQNWNWTWPKQPLRCAWKEDWQRNFKEDSFYAPTKEHFWRFRGPMVPTQKSNWWNHSNILEFNCHTTTLKERQCHWDCVTVNKPHINFTAGSIHSVWMYSTGHTCGFNAHSHASDMAP